MDFIWIWIWNKTNIVQNVISTIVRTRNVEKKFSKKYNNIVFKIVWINTVEKRYMIFFCCNKYENKIALDVWNLTIKFILCVVSKTIKIFKFIVIVIKYNKHTTEYILLHSIVFYIHIRLQLPSVDFVCDSNKIYC